MLIGWVIVGLIIVAGIAINIFIFYRTYKKIVGALNVDESAIKIKPSKSRFIISWLIYSIATTIPVYAVIWVLPLEKEFFYSMLAVFLILLVSSPFLAYPHYTVIIFESKLNGATLLAWGWERTEISFNEIDKAKVLESNFWRNFGITVFKSARGTKILTLGLNDLQIKQIAEYAGEGNRQ